MEHIVQSEEPGFERNLLNRALLNTDETALRMYKAQRAKRKAELAAATRINALEVKMDRLLALFERMLEKNNEG